MTRKLGFREADLCCVCVLMKQFEKMSITPASAAVARIPFAKDVRRPSSLSKIGHTIPPTDAP